jgi:hypothetical protein
MLSGSSLICARSEVFLVESLLVHVARSEKSLCASCVGRFHCCMEIATTALLVVLATDSCEWWSASGFDLVSQSGPDLWFKVFFTQFHFSASCSSVPVG